MPPSRDTQQLRIIFSKSQGARFLSHLDLMATFEYAVRRAALPIKLSEGFNPRPRLSLAAPLAVGYVGEQEVLELSLREPLAPGDVHDRLQAVLPPGIRIDRVDVLAYGEKSAAATVRRATYRIDLPEPIPDLAQRLAVLLDQPSLPARENRKNGVRERDLRPFLLHLEAPDSATIRLAIALGPAGTIRPEQLLPFLNIRAEGSVVTRESIDLVNDGSRSSRRNSLLLRCPPGS